MMDIVRKLYETGNLTDAELKALILTDDNDAAQLLRKYADEVRQRWYGRKVFLRSLSVLLRILMVLRIMRIPISMRF